MNYRIKKYRDHFTDFKNPYSADVSKILKTDPQGF